MLHESIFLRRSMRERRSTIYDDYVIFLQENEENDGIMEDDLINFHQAMQDPNSEKWIKEMDVKDMSMQDNKV